MKSATYMKVVIELEMCEQCCMKQLWNQKRLYSYIRTYSISKHKETTYVQVYVHTYM